MATTKNSLATYLHAEDFLGAVRACRELGSGTLERVHERKLGSAVTSIVTSRSARSSEPEVFAACEDRSVFMFSGQLETVWSAQLDGTADSLVLFKDSGQRLLAAGCSDGAVRFMSAADGRVVTEVGLRASDVRALCWSGSHVLAGTRDGTVFRIERGKKGRPAARTLFKTDGVRSLWTGMFGGEARILLGTYRGGVELRDMEGGKLARADLPIVGARQPDQMNNWVRAVSVVAVGKRQLILAGSENDTVAAFSYGDDRLTPVWRYHSAAWVFSLEATDLNGDGRKEVVVGTWDGTLHVLAADSGDLLWVVDAADRVFSLRATQARHGEPRLVVGLSSGLLYSLKPHKGAIVRTTRKVARVKSELLTYLRNWPLGELHLESLEDARCVLHGLARFHEARLWPLRTDSYERTLWQTLLFLVRLTGQRLVSAARVKTGNWVTSLGTLDVDGDDRPEIVAASADGEIHLLKLDGTPLGPAVTLTAPVVSVAAALAAARTDVCLAATSDGRLLEVAFGHPRNGRAAAPPSSALKEQFSFPISDFQPRHGRRSSRCVVASEEGLFQWGGHGGPRLILAGNVRRALPSRDGDRLIVGLDGERVLCCTEAKQGATVAPIWSRHLQAGEISALAASDDAAFVGTASGYVVALSWTDGAPLWLFKAGGEITTLVATADRLFAGSNDSCVYCFGLAGQLQWLRRMADWVQSALYIPAGGGMQDGQSDELLVVGSADRNVHILQLEPKVDPLLNACWAELRRCGKDLETLLQETGIPPELPSSTRSLLRVFALSRVADGTQFARHDGQFWSSVESTEPVIRPLIVAFLPKVAPYLSPQDWDRLLEHFFATTSDVALLVDLVNTLAALEGEVQLRWERLLKHYHDMSPPVRYAVLGLAAKRAPTEARRFLRNEPDDWLRAQALPKPLPLVDLPELFRESSNVLVHDAAREHIATELELLAARESLKAAATFSTAVILSARRAFEVRYAKRSRQLSLAICGSVARLQALEGVSDPDFFVLVDDRERLSKADKTALLAEGIDILIDAAGWLGASGLVIDVDEVRRRLLKRTPKETAFEFGKFPTLILLSSLTGTSGSNRESNETVTRRLTIAAESEGLWNADLLAAARLSVQQLWGVRTKLLAGQVPEQLQTQNDQWWQGVLARELKVEPSRASSKNSIKVWAYRPVSYYALRIPLEVARQRRSSDWLFEVLQRNWIGRLSAAMSMVNDSAATALLLRILDRMEEVVALLRDPTVQKEFSEDSVGEPHHGIEAAMKASRAIGSDLEELSKVVASAPTSYSASREGTGARG